MERRAVWIVRVAGTVVLVLFVAFQVVNPKRAVVANTPGFRDPVVGFELAATPDDVLGILGRPGNPERAEAVRRMQVGTWVDFVFLLAYPAFHIGIALWLGTRGASRLLVRLVIALAVVMAVGDALENRELLHLTDTVDPAAMWPALARLRIFTLTKWYALFTASALIAALVWREPGWWRWTAPLFNLAAGVGFASVVYLPAIEWSLAPMSLAWIATYARSLAGAAT